MHNLIICLINPVANFSLGYSTLDSAKVARENVHKARKELLLDKTDSIVTITDDYGHRLDVVASNIAAVMIQDNQRNHEKTNDSNIDLARANEVFLKAREGNVELLRLFPGGAQQQFKVVN